MSAVCRWIAIKESEYGNGFYRITPVRNTGHEEKEPGVHGYCKEGAFRIHLRLRCKGKLGTPVVLDVLAKENKSCCNPYSKIFVTKPHLVLTLMLLYLLHPK